MKQTLKFISAIILMISLAACAEATPVPTVVATNIASPTLVPATSVPIVDPAVSISENVDSLTEVEQLDIGTLRGDPVYSTDGHWLFLPTSVGVFVLDTASYEKNRFLIPASPYTYFYPIDISSDGKTLAISRDLVSTGDGHLLPGLEIPSNFEKSDSVIHTVKDAKFSPDGQFITLVYSSDNTGVWRLADRKLLYTLQGASLGFSADSRLIITTGSEADPYIHLYDVQTGKLLQNWAGERAVFLSATRLVVETSGAIRVYDLSTGKVPYAFSGKYAAFSPDGQFVAMLFYDRVEVREVETGKLLHTLDGNFVGVDSLNLRFAPDGQTLAGSAYWSYCCGGGAGALSLWRVMDGALIKATNTAGNFYFSPDGKSLIVTGQGVQIWNTSDGSIRTTVQ